MRHRMPGCSLTLLRRDLLGLQRAVNLRNIIISGLSESNAALRVLMSTAYLVTLVYVQVRNSKGKKYFKNSLPFQCCVEHGIVDVRKMHKQ